MHTQERAIQVHTQERTIQVHTQNALSKCTLRTCYPSAHSEHAIQVHTQEHAIIVHTQEYAIQVHGILVYYSYLCTSRASLVLVHPFCAPLLSCTQLVHPSRAPNSCITRTRAPISCTSTFVHHQSCALLVHCYIHSCTATYSRAPISCTTHTRAPISCTILTRAPLVLEYHSAISCTSIISCTSRAPPCSTRTTLVHHSRAPLSCTTLVHTHKLP